MAEAKTINRRRRRAVRDRIPDGEYRNITTRVTGSTYNRLAEAAAATNTSVSYIVECLCAGRKIEYAQPLRPKPEDQHAAVEAAIRKLLAAEGAPSGG